MLLPIALWILPNSQALTPNAWLSNRVIFADAGRHLVRLFDIDRRGLVPRVNQVDCYYNCYLTPPSVPHLAASGGEMGDGGG
jgi:hypothetical protein